jgi:hypothetical protein
MEFSFDYSKSLLFSVIDSLLVCIREDFLSYSSVQCLHGTASKMAKTIPTNHPLPLLRHLHFRLHFALLALQVFKLVSEMSLLNLASTPRTVRCASHTSSSKRRRIHYDCAGDCHSTRCVCYKNGTRCTTYCHRCSSGCPNKLTLHPDSGRRAERAGRDRTSRMRGDEMEE